MSDNRAQDCDAPVTKSYVIKFETVPEVRLKAPAEANFLHGAYGFVL